MPEIIAEDRERLTRTNPRLFNPANYPEDVTGSWSG
jgi:hypothetical protein